MDSEDFFFNEVFKLKLPAERPFQGEKRLF